VSKDLSQSLSQTNRDEVIAKSEGLKVKLLPMLTQLALHTRITNT
jgi:hypothetical protein